MKIVVKLSNNLSHVSHLSCSANLRILPRTAGLVCYAFIAQIPGCLRQMKVGTDGIRKMSCNGQKGQVYDGASV